MAKAWYPVIDYSTCIECGNCVEKCPHGVYDRKKAPAPVVRSPLSCVDHCHGCGNRCPVGAITYVGEDTGWTPPNGENFSDEEACSCASAASSAKTILVEHLYLDLQVCDRCIGTDQVLEEVILALSPALALAGYVVEYRKIEMASPELATRYHFLASPTIRVNGRDLCASVSQNDCGCCGEISGTQVDCRTFEYQGETYEVPPKQMLAEGVLSAVFGEERETAADRDYRLPENLSRFYAGKQSKSGCGYGGGSCCKG